MDQSQAIFPGAADGGGSGIAAAAGGVAARLLIVDGDAAACRAIERVATEIGFEVLATGNAESATKIVRAWQPSTVVVGVDGAIQDGIAVLGQLSAAKYAAPVVLLGGIDRREIEAAQQFGVSRGLRIEAVLEKPIGAHGLRDHLSRLKPSPKPDLSGDLAEAVQGRHLFLEYQPKYALAGGRMVGAEALVRWQHPVHGVIQPADFLGVAEGADLIQLVTDWVFSRAVEQAAEWRRHGIELEVAVNITAQDLREGRFAERLEQLCRDAGVPSSTMLLELTEASAMRPGPEGAAVLDRLRAKGFQLALDNFGSGWFSLLQLRKLPLSQIKLDRSLVIGLSGNADLQAVAAVVVDLAKKFGLKSVAQGVQDQATLDFLAAVGCDTAQGHHMSAAVKPERVAELARGR